MRAVEERDCVCGEAEKRASRMGEERETTKRKRQTTCAFIIPSFFSFFLDRLLLILSSYTMSSNELQYEEGSDFQPGYLIGCRLHANGYYGHCRCARGGNVVSLLGRFHFLHDVQCLGTPRRVLVLLLRLIPLWSSLLRGDGLVRQTVSRLLRRRRWRRSG